VGYARMRKMNADETLIVERQSGFQRIRITQNGSGCLSVYFGNGEAIQSRLRVEDPRYLGLPYVRTLLAALAFQPNPLRVLVVGLGGGTIPRYLQSCFPAVSVEVAEIDPMMVELAREYCGLVEGERLRVLVGDARDVIESAEGKYGAIFLDGFGEDSIPSHLNTGEFLEGVKRSLAPGGVVLANIWGSNRNRLYGRMLQTYREVFKDLYVLDVPVSGSKVFVGLDEWREVNREKFLEWVGVMSRAHGLGVELGEAVAGFRNGAEERPYFGERLRD
jgi:spermidine synthase